MHVWEVGFDSNWENHVITIICTFCNYLHRYFVKIDNRNRKPKSKHFGSNWGLTGPLGLKLCASTVNVYISGKSKGLFGKIVVNVYSEYNLCLFPELTWIVSKTERFGDWISLRCNNRMQLMKAGDSLSLQFTPVKSNLNNNYDLFLIESRDI